MSTDPSNTPDQRPRNVNPFLVFLTLIPLTCIAGIFGSGLLGSLAGPAEPSQPSASGLSASDMSMDDCYQVGFMSGYAYAYEENYFSLTSSGIPKSAELEDQIKRLVAAADEMAAKYKPIVATMTDSQTKELIRGTKAGSVEGVIACTEALAAESKK